MATYITMLKYTQQGITDIKESPNRLDAAGKAWAENGATLKSFDLTMGRCDAIVISEAASENTMAGSRSRPAGSRSRPAGSGT